MSGEDASASARVDGDVGAEPMGEYDAMLATLDTAIEEAERKVASGRVYDAENEKVRIKWIRALAYAVNVRRQVQSDRDLQELAERVEALEREGTDTGVDGEAPAVDFTTADT